MKKLVSLVLALTMVMSLVAFSASADGEKAIRIGIPYESSTLDPSNANDDASYRVVYMYVEPLLLNVNGEVVPAGAESYEASEDAMEYVFHLRKESCFSDGTPVTAQDYAYSILRTLDMNGAYQNASTLYNIVNGEAYNSGECTAEEVGVKVLDDYTLQLNFAYPTYPAFFTSYIWSALKQSFVEEKGIAYGAEAANVLGAGPFTVDSWVHDSEIILSKNQNYWNKDAVALDKIIVKLNAIGDTAIDMMLTGELDIADMKTLSQVNTLLDEGYEKYSNVSGVNCLHVNFGGKTEDTALFLSNANFRKALCYALDRTALLTVSNGTSSPASRLVGPSETGVNGSFHEEYPLANEWKVTADPETAKAYLDAALTELGKAASDIPTLNILCFDSNSNMILLSAVIDMWSKTLGVNAVIDAQPIQNMIAKMYTGDWDFWLGGIDKGSDVDSVGLLTYYITDGGLFNINDAEFDALYNATNAATTWQAHKDALAAAEAYFVDNMMDLAMYWMNNTYMVDSAISGVVMDSHCININFADIAK